jgi:copper oxidase (laccase) domain-containing protein
VIRSCTFTEKNLWFSFRREKQRTGSNWSWVVREAFSTTSR